ncbi:fatty acid desaturase [Pseudoponticoccus marisrubri]|uniref:Fatty acid desaturase n=1 Tax=Pseudoponticoccus marisrubri TaxID=1685382 RepID=A0A0W7WGC0_9RHOB|nr:fatty acid desaturase [Pseudoponticoccus marisrubri]KUF09676.1 fatty acid desaturase [Pseudoponticoccus marisrubri]
MNRALRGVEWPTLALTALCYGLWALGTTALAEFWLPLGMAVTIVTTALHSSLTHEALHGHPTRSPLLNAALVFPALSVVVPYLRFKDTHLAHHRDSILTDPYDDPESNYMDPAVWARLPRPVRAALRFNNTLAGRLLLGPLIGTLAFVAADLRALRRGAPRWALGWALHVPAVALVLGWMAGPGQMPLWTWALCVYAALSILKIRTFLEHRAHEDARGRTVIIEDRGPLALIFLNNNLHVVHHMHAAVPWYRLPVLYRENRQRYLGRNTGYFYRSYAEIFRRHFWRAKDPVPHPLWPDP